ncbi:MAG: hypothetical protein H0T62_04590 [Parachlamydiaceae bacterium]|nr:hypothetical protein [Parachlamydiaceae bacterium]
MQFPEASECVLKIEERAHRYPSFIFEEQNQVTAEKVNTQGPETKIDHSQTRTCLIQ